MNEEMNEIIPNETVEEIAEVLPETGNGTLKKIGAVAGIAAGAIGLWEGGKRLIRWGSGKLKEWRMKAMTEKTEVDDIANDILEDEIPDIK